MRPGCIGGGARFSRFVELDVPFRITAVGRAATGRGRRVDLTISRQGQDNASIYLVVVAGDA